MAWGAELSPTLTLKGAVIDGVVYGDTTLVLAVEDISGRLIPTNIALQQNYPNPFNPETTIQFSLDRLREITLIIFDISGREVMKLIDYQVMGVGEHKIVWNGKNQEGVELPSGVYFCQLRIGARTLTHPMVLIR